MFASGSDDGQVIIWDIENNGTDPTNGNGEDGPPTQLFPHEMHKSAIEDIAWRPSNILKGDSAKDLLLGSLETQNQFHVYQMKEEFTYTDNLKEVEDLYDLIDDAELE